MCVPLLNLTVVWMCKMPERAGLASYQVLSSYYFGFIEARLASSAGRQQRISKFSPKSVYLAVVKNSNRAILTRRLETDRQEHVLAPVVRRIELITIWYNQSPQETGEHR